MDAASRSVVPVVPSSGALAEHAARVNAHGRARTVGRRPFARAIDRRCLTRDAVARAR